MRAQVKLLLPDMALEGIRLAKPVEPSSFGKRLLDWLLRWLNRLADGQVANQLILLRNAKHIRHLAADVVRVRDVPFDPAALVAEGDGGEQDIFDCGGVILNEK